MIAVLTVVVVVEEENGIDFDIESRGKGAGGFIR